MATQLAEREELSKVTIDRRNDAGDVLGTVQLSSEIFGRTPNVPLMHQVVTAQLAARRSGTHSTRTRAEVRGGGAKPYRQKGTGRARQGTIRAPQFAGGGVAFGPKPRSYAQHTPRKMTRLALYCALSDRAAEGKICLVDRWSFDIPKTKDAVKSLQALEIEGSVLVVIGPDDSSAERSFANLPEVDIVEASQLTAYDVMVNDWIVFTDATVPGEVSEVSGAPAKKRATQRKSAGDSTSEPAADEAASGSDEPAADETASGSDEPSSKPTRSRPRKATAEETAVSASRKADEAEAEASPAEEEAEDTDETEEDSE